MLLVGRDTPLKVTGELMESWTCLSTALSVSAVIPVVFTLCLGHWFSRDSLWPGAQVAAGLCLPPATGWAGALRSWELTDEPT